VQLTPTLHFSRRAREKVFVLREVVHCHQDDRRLVNACSNLAGDTLAVVDDANGVSTLDVANMATEAELGRLIGPIHSDDAVRADSPITQPTAPRARLPGR